MGKMRDWCHGRMKWMKIGVVILHVLVVCPSPNDARPNKVKRDTYLCGEPAVCKCMDDIKWVDCSNKNLNVIPKFSPHVYLSTERLFLNENNITGIPVDDEWYKWKSLEAVDISGNPVCKSSQVSSLRNGEIDLISDVCPSTTPPTTPTPGPAHPTPDTLPSDPPPTRGRLPVIIMGNGSTTDSTITTTTVTTTRTTTTTRVFTTEEGDEGEGATDVTDSTSQQTEKKTPTTTTTTDSPPPKQTTTSNDILHVNENIFLIGSLSVSVPLGVLAISCCMKGMYKRFKNFTSKRRMVAAFPKPVTRPKRPVLKFVPVPAIDCNYPDFDCVCNSASHAGRACGVSETSFTTAQFHKELNAEDEVVFEQSKTGGTRRRTPSLNKEE